MPILDDHEQSLASTKWRWCRNLSPECARCRWALFLPLDPLRCPVRDVDYLDAARSSDSELRAVTAITRAGSSDRRISSSVSKARSSLSKGSTRRRATRSRTSVSNFRTLLISRRIDMFELTSLFFGQTPRRLQGRTCGLLRQERRWRACQADHGSPATLRLPLPRRVVRRAPTSPVV